MQLLAANSSALRNSKHISPDSLLQLTSDKRKVLTRECKTSSQKQFHAVIAGSLVSSAGQCHGTSQSALWLPFDLFLEDSMDGSQVTATGAVEILTGTSHFLHLHAKIEKCKCNFWTSKINRVDFCCRFSKGSSSCESNFLA